MLLSPLLSQLLSQLRADCWTWVRVGLDAGLVVWPGGGGADSPRLGLTWVASGSGRGLGRVGGGVWGGGAPPAWLDLGACGAGRALDCENTRFCGPRRTLERENMRFCGPGRALDRENTRFCGPGRTWDRENTWFSGSERRARARVESVVNPKRRGQIFI